MTERSLQNNYFDEEMGEENPNYKVKLASINRMISPEIPKFEGSRILSVNSEKRFSPNSSDDFRYSKTSKNIRKKDEDEISDVSLGSRGVSYFSPSSKGKKDYFKYYNERENSENSHNKQVLFLLEQMNLKIQKQDEMIKNLMNNKKASPKTYSSFSYINNNFTQPDEENQVKSEIDEESSEDDDIDMPDFENMSDDELAYYRAKYSKNFELLRKSYPSFIIKTLDIDKLSLQTIHMLYCEIVYDINLCQTAMKLKIVLILFFAGIELLGRRFKINAIKKFLRIQLKRIDKYNSYLMEMARVICNKKRRKWPAWIAIFFNVAISVLSYVSIQFCAQSYVGSAPDDILKEADRFITPDGSNVKYKDDMVPDVPELPEGYQDPNYIISKIPGFLDIFEGDNDKPAEPVVKEKKIDNDEYDEIY